LRPLQRSHFYLIPLFVQTVQGYTPLQAGLLLMPAGLIMGLALPLGGYLTDKLPASWLIMAGLLFFGASCYWFGGADVNTSFTTLAVWVIFGRIAMALINPSLNAGALRALDSAKLGQGSGMINFFRQLGAAFGVNLLSVMLDRRTSFHSNAIATVQTPGNSSTVEFLRSTQELLAQAGVSSDLQLPGALHFLDRVVYAQAYTLGFRDSFLICALVFMLAMIPAWLMGRTRAAASPESDFLRSAVRPDQ
jgi:hypothetical protein